MAVVATLRVCMCELAEICTTLGSAITVAWTAAPRSRLGPATVQRLATQGTTDR
jgi:hypothetical protein